MSRAESVVGLGLPLVDIKLSRETLLYDLPTHSPEELLQFVEDHNQALWAVGGMIPNLLTAYCRVKPDSPVQLWGCVGDDTRGRFYQTQYEQKIGALQVDPDKPTGFVAIVIDYNGSTYKAKSFDGACESVKVTDTDRLTHSSLFVTNANILRLPAVVAQAEQALHIVKQKSGVFVFSLGGLRSYKTTRDTMFTQLNALHATPHVVFANEPEMCYAANVADPDLGFATQFLNSRLVVMTQGDRGVLCRFEGRTFHIPPFALDGKNPADTQGAGDTLMGLMLAVLNEKKYADWNIRDVKVAAHTAAFGAARVIQSLESQLQPADVTDVVAYRRTIEQQLKD